MEHDMTVAELQQMLEDFEPDTKVRFAHQPDYPMQLRIGSNAAYRMSRDCQTKILYLLDAGQPYDAPYAPEQIFEQFEDPSCAGCGANECEQGEEFCSACLSAEDEKAS